MSLLNEFKKFALKGSVVDLAVGIVIGAAFTKVVSALVDNVLMPPLGMLIGGVDFSDLKIVLAEASGENGEVAIGYGLLIQSLVHFFIVAWALFILIRAMNKMRLQPQPVAATPEDILLLRDIRDSLKR